MAGVSSIAAVNLPSVQALGPRIPNAPILHREALLQNPSYADGDASLGSDSTEVVSGQAISGTTWKLYNEKNVTSAIVDAINGAKHVVNVEFFAFTDAGKGAQIVAALENAARRGVEVNVITDFVSMGSPPVGSWFRMRKKIREAGGTVIQASRFPLSPSSIALPALKHVNHRKIITIDGNNAFVGGMNFAPISDGYADTLVNVNGVTAARLGANQLDRWKRVGGKVTKSHQLAVSSHLGKNSLKATDARELRVLSNSPDQEKYELTDAYAEMIRNAKHRIWISTPGISDRDLMDELHAAARRGVDVRIISSEDPPVGAPVGWVARAHLNELIENGGKAYEIPGTLHRKLLIADNETVVSSYNITKRSARADHEVGLRTKDRKFVKTIEALMKHDMDRSPEYDPDNLQGITKLIGDAFAEHISY